MSMRKVTMGCVKLLPRIFIFAMFFTVCFGQELGPRSAYNVPLIKMTLGFDEQNNQFRHVRVPIDGTNEYAIITRIHDMLVKNTRAGVAKTHYQEAPDRAFIISAFEAEQVDRAVVSFIETLVTFEKDLKRERWDRCRYLDSYLPRFLKRFYYLVCAARNSPNAMPRISRIPDDEYDVSMNSPKSDMRVKMWQDESEYIIKLRIIAKELAFQLETWQKKELRNSNRNMEVAYSAKAEEAYDLFVRMYFNLKPPPEVPSPDKHL